MILFLTLLACAPKAGEMRPFYALEAAPDRGLIYATTGALDAVLRDSLRREAFPELPALARGPGPVFQDGQILAPELPGSQAEAAAWLEGQGIAAGADPMTQSQALFAAGLLHADAHALIARMDPLVSEDAAATELLAFKLEAVTLYNLALTGRAPSAWLDVYEAAGRATGAGDEPDDAALATLHGDKVPAASALAWGWSQRLAALEAARAGLRPSTVLGEFVPERTQLLRVARKAIGQSKDWRAIGQEGDCLKGSVQISTNLPAEFSLCVESADRGLLKVNIGSVSEAKVHDVLDLLNRLQWRLAGSGLGDALLEPDTRQVVQVRTLTPGEGPADGPGFSQLQINQTLDAELARAIVVSGLLRLVLDGQSPAAAVATLDQPTPELP